MSDQARRQRMLDEMGLGPVWTLRERTQAGQPLSDGPAQALETQPAALQAPPAPAPDSRQSREPLRNPLQHAGPPPRPEPQPMMPAPRPNPSEVAQLSWDELREAVAGCTRCDLCRGRTKTVFGVGARNAKWLFVGEGPGRNEDLQGEPFVGPAGKLLDNMLAAMGLQRGVNAFIANIVKCRPTDGNGRDRPPTPVEMAACLPYLERQIDLIQPTVVVALGKTAAIALLGADPETPVSRLRGSVHRYRNLPLIVTYHPAYLLRSLQEKSKAWRDLCLAMDAYAAADAST